MKKFFQINVIDFISKQLYKKVSFYLSFVACLLALMASIIFGNKNITQAQDLQGYFDQSGNINLILSIVALIVLVVFSLCKETFLYGKAISWALIFANFLIYVKTIYMYFAGVFYNGFSPEAVQSIDKGCLYSIILFLVAAILGNVAIYLDNRKKVAKNVVEEN